MVQRLAAAAVDSGDEEVSSGRRREGSKFISYFDLWDALAQPGCPVCRLVDRDSFRFLDALLYERVNDVGTRERLRKSLGFCNWHAWKSLEVPNGPLGLGIIYNDLLERIRERLAKIQSSFPRRLPWLRRLLGRKKAKESLPVIRPPHSCPVCQSVGFFEEIYLRVLLDFISEEDFERQFSRSPGVCFPHLIVAIEKFSGHVNLSLLIQEQMKKYESLRAEVAEFIRKRDFRFAHEPSGPEADSWKRALEMTVGKREIFPNQMIRERRRPEKDPSTAGEEIANGEEKEGGLLEEKIF